MRLLDGLQASVVSVLTLVHDVDVARVRVLCAVRDDDKSLAETKEITDRTEGKARQDIGIETDEKAVPIIDRKSTV